MNDRYHIEQLPNGLIRVFDRASKLAGCYHRDGRYAFGDLRAETVDDLLRFDEERGASLVLSLELHTEEVIQL